MRFSDVKDYVGKGLASRGWDPVPQILPGPSDNTQLQKLGPRALVFVTLGDGRGFTTELVFDQPFIRVRAIGAQHSYDDAEKLAQDLDFVLCSTDTNTAIGNSSALYITRAGGAPSLLELDLSDRYHFTCTYITETPSGL